MQMVLFKLCYKKSLEQKQDIAKIICLFCKEAKLHDKLVTHEMYAAITNKKVQNTVY